MNETPSFVEPPPPATIEARCDGRGQARRAHSIGFPPSIAELLPMCHHLSSLRAWAHGACAVALAFALCSTASAQAVASPAPARAAAPDGTALLATIQALTAPGMDGRASGTPGNARGARLDPRTVHADRRRASGQRRSFEVPFSFT